MWGFSYICSQKSFGMFSKETYIMRRKALREQVGDGLIVLLGNNESPANYPANAYRMRQDSSFLYFFGQKREGLAGVIDAVVSVGASVVASVVSAGCVGAGLPSTKSDSTPHQYAAIFL